jgi:CRP-like cAMP-binding protein
MTRGVPKAIIEMLHQVPLLTTCTRAELRQIANLGAHLSMPDGKVLIQQGKPGREFFLLLGGKALCYVDGELMATFQTGDFFGEMALLKKGPRQATVVVDGGADLLVLDGREFEANATLYS